MDNKKINKEYDLFISYRRSTGWQLARLLYERLTRKGLKVFLDVDKLGSGQFDTALLTSIENSKNFIIVCSGTSLDACSNEGDWVRQEIAHALKCNKNIIPVFCDGYNIPKTLPDELKKLSTLNGIKIDYDHYETDMIKIENMLYDVDFAKAKKIDQQVDNAFYQGDNLTEESQRLNVKLNLDREIDLPIIEKLTKDFDQLNILDLGCGNANRIVDRFGKNPRVNKIVCTDSNPWFLQNAPKLHNNPKMSFHELSVEDPKMKDNLLKIADQNGVRFNLVHISYVLLNHTNPQQIIRAVKASMAPGGKIMIIDVDDAYNIAFPDKNNMFARINRIRARSPLSGYRNTGRQIFGCLKKAGFKNIKMDSIVQTNCNLTHEQKDDLFQTEYGRIKKELEDLVKKYPGEEEYQNDYKWLCEVWDDLEYEYHSDLFFQSTGYIIFTAEI